MGLCLPLSYFIRIYRRKRAFEGRAVKEFMEKRECLRQSTSTDEMFYKRTAFEDSEIKRVTVEVTSRCNLKCSICFRHGWTDKKTGNMDEEVFERLKKDVNDTDSIEQVFFGGMGEPLFHPNICDMIRSFSTKKKVGMITNGTLLDRKMAEALVEAGLHELWISMDGFEEDCYENIQTGSNFKRICENIDTLNQVRSGSGLQLCITFVVTPENRKQLELINDFADSVGADLLNISHMIPGAPISREMSIYDDPRISIGKMHRYEEDRPPFPNHVCPFIEEGQVFVRWDGDVIPCMQLLHGCYTYLYEEKRKITSFSFGNLREKSLSECWNAPDYAALRERVQTFFFPFCTDCWGCEDRKENLTDCFDGESPTCGACIWATGKVRCP